MSDTRKHILFVDQHYGELQEPFDCIIEEIYPGRFMTKWVGTTKEAQEQLKIAENYSVIVFGYYLFGYVPTVKIVKEFKVRARPDCMIIAYSNDMSFRSELMTAGCTHTSRGKDEMPSMLSMVL